MNRETMDGDGERADVSVVEGSSAEGSGQRVYNSIVGAIGNTPLVDASSLCANRTVRLLLKLEYLNPTGSIKDRIVHHMVCRLEEQGRLLPGGTIVENSSGNTAASVALVAGVKGYRSVLVVPSKCSEEKRAIIRAFGGEVTVAPPGALPGSEHHYEQIARRLEREIPGAVRLDQYDNLENVEAHYRGTGPEIWRQTGGKVDVVVAGASTGGTISGVAKYLKERNSTVRAVIADPAGSALVNMVRTREMVPTAGRTVIEGIGKDYHVNCTLIDLIDSAYCVTDAEAVAMAHRLAREHGVFGGMSSGANVAAAVQHSRSCPDFTTIVCILPDGGFKYLSKLFNDDWLQSQGLPTTAARCTTATPPDGERGAEK